MPSSENLLLVEGESDKRFFETVCALRKLRASVHVAPPREVGGRGNNKQGLIDLLPTILDQLADGSVKRLAIVVDADYLAHSGLGFARTFLKIETALNGSGFACAKNPPQHSGLIFRNPDGLADVGAWIMPNNRSDGSLEDFLHGCISPGEQSLFQRARATVKALPDPRFSATHVGKAELATWLAWQKDPGRAAHHALEEGRFDAAGPSFAGLTGWLARVFK